MRRMPNPWVAIPVLVATIAGGRKEIFRIPNGRHRVFDLNDDNDVEFDEVIPSNFDLPNLMVVAAVDQAGDPTGFTSGGRNVRLYANGFEVESYVPGGERMEMSGTSMACPAAVGAAAAFLSARRDLLDLPRDSARSEAMARAVLGRAKTLGFGSLYEGQGLVR